MVNASQASEKDSQFKNEAENVWNQKYQQQLQSDKLKFEGMINSMLQELGNMCKSSQDSLTIFQQLANLKPILSEIGAAVVAVDNDVYYKLYLKFRSIFKQFNNIVDECTTISKQSLNGKIDTVKMQEIKNLIQNISKQLESLQQNVYSETKDKYHLRLMSVIHKKAKENMFKKIEELNKNSQNKV